MMIDSLRKRHGRWLPNMVVYMFLTETTRKEYRHGSPLPTLMHGGPGRAGGGEEMGGLSGLHFLAKRLSSDILTAITRIYQQGAEKNTQINTHSVNILKK